MHRGKEKKECDTLERKGGKMQWEKEKRTRE